jgi:hypothetical protein
MGCNAAGSMSKAADARPKHRLAAERAYGRHTIEACIAARR